MKIPKAKIQIYDQLYKDYKWWEYEYQKTCKDQNLKDQNDQINEHIKSKYSRSFIHGFDIFLVTV